MTQHSDNEAGHDVSRQLSESEQKRVNAINPESARQGLKDSHLSSSAPAPDFGRRLGGWMLVLLWIILLAGAALLAQRWLNEREIAREARVLVDEYGQQALLLQQDRYGQYLLKGSANNQEVIFLLDTGASGISIPASVAQRLRLERGRPFPVVTANGTVEVYSTELDSIRIGPFARTKVQAHINPSMQGDVALLGMSFLRHYELLQRSGELTISLPGYTR